MDQAHVISVSAGVILLICAACHDVVARTVPNWVAALVAVAGVSAQVTQGNPALGDPLTSGLAALGVFIAAAFAWRRGWMGGGDVKLLAAAALLVPAYGVPGMLMATALAGGVLAIFYLIARRRITRPGGPRPSSLLLRACRAERWRLRRGGPMPYAVAIACGALFVLSHGAFP